jgi:hypothetical protein
MTAIVTESSSLPLLTVTKAGYEDEIEIDPITVELQQQTVRKCVKSVFVDNLRYVVNNVDNHMDMDNSELMSAQYPPKVTVSGTDIRVKELVLIAMALCLLICSVCLFFKHWKKNYRDINQVINYHAFINVQRSESQNKL